MKRTIRRQIRRQEPQHARGQKPFFASAGHEKNDTGAAPFFQAQVNEGEMEENVQALQKAEMDDEKVRKESRDADEEKKENAPVMKKS